MAMTVPAHRPAPTNAPDPILDGVVEAITEKLQTGEPVDLEAIAQAHPEHADRLRRLLPALELMADLGRSAAREIDSQVPPTSEPLPGSGVLGDFRILRQIGRGGMGIVYEVEQLSLG